MQDEQQATMSTLQPQSQIAAQVAALSTEDQALVRDFVAYLHWRRSNPCEQDRSQEREWRYSFLEYFAQADVRAAKDAKGMEVKTAMAAVGGMSRAALWQHPPVSGESLVEFHVPVPAGLKHLRLRFAIGIREGSQGADQLVAFRVKIDGWQVWSRAAWPQQWEPNEIELPFQAGNVLRLAFATDGLGIHRFAWAAWAEPELVGELG
jgi:hypothetical protein